MKFVITILAVLFSMMLNAGEYEVADGLKSTVIFKSGEGGYPHFRIPTIERAANGMLLAFAEARYLKDDHGRNDIVLKRSGDNGKTWGKLQIIDADREQVFLNPSPVTLKNGNIILIYESFPWGFHCRAGKHFKMMSDAIGGVKSQRCFVRVSKDNGKTWSGKKDITKVTRDRKGIVNSGNPANGIQLKHGKYRGRVIAPMFYVTRVDEKKRTLENGCIYSDDNGRTWKKGGNVTFENDLNFNECLVVELEDGSIMMNSRAKSTSRFVAISKDGGASWSSYTMDPNLKGRWCNAGILRVRTKKGDDRAIAFCNNFHMKKRANGYLRLSYDDGKSWPVGKTIVPGLFGYCQLVNLEPGYIGVIYEPFMSVSEDWDICFIRVPISWLKK